VRPAFGSRTEGGNDLTSSDPMLDPSTFALASPYCANTPDMGSR
jgi:hypothetical protein